METRMEGRGTGTSSLAVQYFKERRKEERKEGQNEIVCLSKMKTTEKKDKNVISHIIKHMN